MKCVNGTFVGQKVENNRLKLTPAKNIDTMRMPSMTGLLKAAMLAFFVLKPQVLHADMAWVNASNQLVPAQCKARLEIKVKVT